MMAMPEQPDPGWNETACVTTAACGNACPSRPVQPHPRVLSRLAWRLLRNHLWVQLTQSRLRSVLLITIAVILWFSLAALTATAFEVLSGTVLPAYVLQHFSSLVLGALAVILAGLLAFSAGLACYLELFRAPDAALLLCSPLSTERIFRYKWLRTLTPGLWTLALLALPVLTQWHICLDAPWWSYLILAVMVGGLLMLAASFGCLVCLLVVYWIPGQSRRLLLALAMLLVALFAWWLGTLVPRETLSDGLFRWLRQFVQRLQPLQWFLAPSQWWSSGLVEAANGHFVRALFFAALLWSNALMLYLVTVWLAGRTYRFRYITIAGLGDRRRQYFARWPTKFLDAATTWLSPPARALLRKDLLTLCRDPVQWTQLGVLAAVLAIYFWTVGQFGQETLPFYLRRILHLLNLAMVALTLATWASRFVYPLVAQEIRAFWLIGMSPIRRSGLLWSKWMFAALLGMTAALAVLTLSHWLLRMDTSALLLHSTAAVMLGLSIAGVSVGMGGLFVEPHEISPTQPLSSYGNTLTLLACTGLALLETGLAAWPVFLDFQAAADPDLILQQGPSAPSTREWMVCLAQLLVGSSATITLLSLGQCRLRRLEW